MIGSVGGVLGAMAARPLSRRFGNGRASTGLLLVGGLSALVIGVPTTASAVWLTAAGLALVGAAVVAGNVIRGAWRLRYVPSHLMARVITTSQVINYGTMPFAGLTAGWLGAEFGVRATILALSGRAYARLLLGAVHLAGPAQGTTGATLGRLTRRKLVSRLQSA